jgi:hypothetical protein
VPVSNNTRLHGNCLRHYKLEGHLEHNILEVCQEYFKAGDEHMELVQFGGLQNTSLSRNVGIAPFIVADTGSAGLTIMIVVQDAVEVSPFLNSSFPMFKCGQRGNN